MAEALTQPELIARMADRTRLIRALPRIPYSSVVQLLVDGEPYVEGSLAPVGTVGAPVDAADLPPEEETEAAPAAPAKAKKAK